MSNDWFGQATNRGMVYIQTYATDLHSLDLDMGNDIGGNMALKRCY